MHTREITKDSFEVLYYHQKGYANPALILKEILSAYKTETQHIRQEMVSLTLWDKNNSAIVYLADLLINALERPESADTLQNVIQLLNDSQKILCFYDHLASVLGRFFSAYPDYHRHLSSKLAATLHIQKGKANEENEAATLSPPG